MNHQEQVDARLRFNAGEAGFAALLLLLFGWFGFDPSDSATGLFKVGDRLTIYGMRFGGLAMAAVAVASKFKFTWSLLADAIISMGVGLALGLGGLALINGGGGWGINYLLYIVFGFMFVSAGIRNGRDYFILFQYVKKEPIARPAERVPARSVDDDPDMASLAERLRKRVSDSTVILPAIGAEPETVQAKQTLPQTEPAKSQEPTKHAQPTSPPTAPSPDGFLASFAKTKDPQS